MRVRRRGVRRGTRLVRRRASGEPVVLFTQTANVRSMRLAAKLGFTEVERFQAYGAEQWFGLWSPVTPSG
jgi:RimJ/RimL family protein N-acetyltransferase